MKNMLYIAEIVDNTIVDGEGFRTSLYLSGCDIFCEGCHNRELWDINYGQPMEIDDVFNRITKHFTNITFIGGEPMMQAVPLASLAEKIKKHTSKSIWIYSGHTFEEILADREYRRLIEFCDVLVDGRYDRNYSRSNLKFKGSENQRIIDIKKSLTANEIILWTDEFEIIP